MKQFRITLLVKRKRMEVLVGGYHLADALSNARRMYPNDTVLKAFPYK
jgi:hypothetical protein